MSWLGQPRICSVWEHRTVRWCTGQCPVRQAGSREKAALGTSTAVYGYNSLDCPVGRSQANSSLSGIHRRRTAIIHRTIRCAPDCPVSQRSAARSAWDTWPSQRLEGGTGLSGVHRTCPVRQRLSVCQRSTVPFMEGNRAPDSVRCAPDCPVRQAGSREKAALGTSTAVYGYNSPDCPVVHQTVQWAVHRRTRRSREFIVDVRL
jgi:hypothetical protein